MSISHSTRSPRQRPTLADLYVDGPPIRLSDLSKLAGFSRQKLMADGRLVILKAHCGTRFMAMVDRAEAVRYLGIIYAKAS